MAQAAQFTPLALIDENIESIEGSLFGKVELELCPSMEPFMERVLAHNENELLCLRQVQHAQQHMKDVLRCENNLLRQKAYLDGELAAFENDDEIFSAEDHNNLMDGKQVTLLLLCLYVY
jgi:hypothetical protein